MDVPGFKVETLSICYYKNTDLEKAIDRLFVDVDRAYRDGANILILSDRGMDENHVAIPQPAGGVGAVSKYLVRTRKRTAMALILESGEPRRRAPLCHPAGLRRLGHQPLSGAGDHRRASSSEGLLDKDYYAAVERLQQGRAGGHREDRLQDGHLHHPVLRRQPRSLRRVGISQDVVDKYFTNTVSRVGGIGHPRYSERPWKPAISEAFDPLGLDINRELPSLGAHKFRSGPAAEQHLYNPQTIHLLQQACWTGNYDTFQAVHRCWPPTRTATPCTCAACWTSTTPRSACRWTRWRAWTSIVKRFKTGAMSYGSISAGGPRVPGRLP